MAASTPTVEVNSGELITLPDMERIPGDRDTVQRLVGDYLSKLDAELTVGSTTLTLETFLVDESGCGILTYTVDDPEGVSYEDAGNGEVYSLPLEPRMYLRSPDYQQGGSINVKLHVDKTTSTAPHLDVVAYFAAGETYQKGDNFYFTVYDGGGEGREPYAVAIQPRTYAPVRPLTAAEEHVTLYYSYDGTEWVLYTGPFAPTAAKVYAKAVDQAGIESAVSQLAVAVADSQPVKTGDAAPLAVYAALLLTAAAALTAMPVLRRRRVR